jgi:hypothetical protein
MGYGGEPGLLRDDDGGVIVVCKVIPVPPAFWLGEEEGIEAKRF